MIPQTQTSSNTFSQTARKYLSDPEFDQANLQKRAWLTAVIQECKLRLSETKVIESLAFLTDPITGIGSPCIGTIREKVSEDKGGDLTYGTISEVLHRLESKGAIVIKRNGKKRSNTFKLVGFQYKLETCSRETLDSLNYPTLRDHTNDITYNEYESIFNNSQEKKEKRHTEGISPPKHKPETHICNAKLKTEPEKEIKRACIAYNVPEAQIQYITKLFKKKTNVPNPGGYLRTMLTKMKNGTWNMVDPTKPIAEHREVEKARALEALQPDTEAGADNLAKIKQMLGTCLADKIILNLDT